MEYLGCQSDQWGSAFSTSHSYDCQGVNLIEEINTSTYTGFLINASLTDKNITKKELSYYNSFFNFTSLINSINRKEKLIIKTITDVKKSIRTEYVPYKVYKNTWNMSYYTWKGMDGFYPATNLTYNYTKEESVTYAAGCRYSKTITFPAKYINSKASNDPRYSSILRDSITIGTRGQSGASHPGWGSQDFYYAYLPTGIYPLI